MTNVTLRETSHVWNSRVHYDGGVSTLFMSLLNGRMIHFLLCIAFLPLIANAVSVTPSSLSFGAQSSGRNVTVYGERYYNKVVYPGWSASPSADFIHVPTSGSANEYGYSSAYVSVDANMSLESRTGSVRFYFSSGGVSESVNIQITQSGQTAEVTCPVEDFNYSENSGYVNVSAVNGTKWFTSSDVDWIVFQSSSGLGQGKAIFSIKKTFLQN